MACGQRRVGGAERHGGVNSEFARGVGRGRDDAALIGLSTDDHGFAFERGIEELFDGDEEGVHVDVEVGLHLRDLPVTRCADRMSDPRAASRHWAATTREAGQIG